jgi:hypothetical protein
MQEIAFAQTQAKRPLPPLRRCTKGRGKARTGRVKGKDKGKGKGRGKGMGKDKS